MTNQAKILRESLRILLRKMDGLDLEQAKCCQLTMTQCHALVEIGRRESLSINALAEILELDKSSTSRMVQILVDKSLVKRRTSVEDRRYMEVDLTEKGRGLFQNIESNMSAYYQCVLDHIPTTEQENVTQLLQILIQAIEKTDQDPSCYQLKQIIP